jgi:chitodextrinase
MNKQLFFLILFISLISPSNGADPEITTQVLPANNIWNTPVNTLPVSPKSSTFINTIGKDKTIHPDFGSGLYDGAPIGIPYLAVSSTQAKVTVTFTYNDESDIGPYPIPANAPIEGGSSSTGDRHVIVVDNTNGILYELYNAFPQTDGTWKADSGAIFSLTKNDLRPDTWTSADAAGLPIFPGLIRYDEVLKGVINHAIRFTTNQTKKEYVWPARHYASSLTDDKYPPMGQRFRLKSTFDSSSYSTNMKVIITALQVYGMILADNGSPWYLSGAPDDRWDNDVLNELKKLKGSDFEAVDCSSLMVSVDSGIVNNFTDIVAPTAPTGLSSASITQSTFTLSWTAATDTVGVTGYKIFNNGALLGTSTTTNYAVTALSSNTSYSFTVSAYDAAANNSVLSTALSITTLTAIDTTAPTAPTDLISNSITLSTFSLSWTASTDSVGVTGYKIFNNGALLGTSSTTNYAVTSLTSNTTYSFTVSAYDAAANNSVLSTALSITTLTTIDTTAPTAPTNLISNSITQSTFSLSWTASTDSVGVTGYKIYKDGILLGTSTTTSFAVTGLTSATTYSFTVSAYDTATNSSILSSALSVTTLTTIDTTVLPDTTAPTVPTNLSSATVTSISLTLSWAASTDTIGVVSYKVYKSGIQIGTSPTTSFAVTELTASTTYSFTVSAIDTAGNNSAQSTPLSVNTSATPIITTTESETIQPTTINSDNNGGGGGCSYSSNSNKENLFGNLFLTLIFFLTVIIRKKIENH